MNDGEMLKLLDSLQPLQPAPWQIEIVRRISNGETPTYTKDISGRPTILWTQKAPTK